MRVMLNPAVAPIFLFFY